MTVNIKQERADFERMRAGYERAFGPAPMGAVWSGFGYAVKTFGASEAKTYAERFKGFIAGQAARCAQVVPQGLAEAWEHSAADTENNHSGAGLHLNQGVAEGMRICAKDLRAMLAAAPRPPEVAPVQLPEPDFKLDGGAEHCYFADTVRQLLATQEPSK